MDGERDVGLREIRPQRILARIVHVGCAGDALGPAPTPHETQSCSMQRRASAMASSGWTMGSVAMPIEAVRVVHGSSRRATR